MATLEINPPQTTYNLLRAALLLFQKPPSELTEEELQRAKIQANNEYKIESQVLDSTEAAGIIISDQELEIAFQEIRGRYQDEESFLIDLEKNQLDKENLISALRRRCKVNTVLDLIAKDSPGISEIEIGIYYHLHPDQFNIPERREASHLFIRTNPNYPENNQLIALARAQELADKLQKKPYKFADLASKFSECPTALKGGSLGLVTRGKLYPELEDVLFQLKQGEVSPVVKSEIGFHVLFCKNILKPEAISLAKATPKIRQLMQGRAKRTCQRAWLASLPIPESGGSYYE
ncbi:MAG: nitrogen fixation protein NifM [Methylococcaceae bacterium]|jgi:peptidylprolyl isomerase/peptidyl-prolyl cis-trans isomerase C